MCVLFILLGEEDFCFMAENQINYIAICKTFIIFGVANSTCFRTLQTNNNEAYEGYTTYLSLSPSTLLHNREAKGNNRSFSI